MGCDVHHLPINGPRTAQAVWYLKCRSLTLKNWIDDTEVEEEVRAGLPPTWPSSHMRSKWALLGAHK